MPTEKQENHLTLSLSLSRKDLVRMTSKFNRVLEDVEIHVRAKYHQAECSGSWVLVRTGKKLERTQYCRALADCVQKKREFSDKCECFKCNFLAAAATSDFSWPEDGGGAIRQVQTPLLSICCGFVVKHVAHELYSKSTTHRSSGIWALIEWVHGYSSLIYIMPKERYFMVVQMLFLAEFVERRLKKLYGSRSKANVWQC